VTGIRIGYALIVTAAILLTVAYVASINEYERVFGPELATAYDCDGPLIVLLFAAPSVVLGGLGIVLLARARGTARHVPFGLVVGMVLVMLGLIRLGPALVEQTKNAEQVSPCR
jgi:hypothetical protein